MHRSNVHLRAATGIALFLLAACADGTTEVQTFPMSVRVEYPATYARNAADGARVILLNTERNTSDTSFADATGIATFARVVPGSYQIAAARALTADEAFGLTGQRTAANLNANIPATSILVAPPSPTVLTLAGSRLGDLVIKEIYYAGSKTPSGGSYFADQFHEIHNNSTDTLYTDSLYIAEVYGNAGQINPTSLPTPFQGDAQNVHVTAIWMVPGSGRSRPLAPGKSVVIAQDGIDHKGDPNGNPASPVDLSTADFETYNLRVDNRDTDAPNVANMERVRFDTRFDWNVAVFGPGIVIFRVPPGGSITEVPVPGSTSGQTVARIPNAWVIDAFEALQNGNSSSYKRVPAALDAGFVFATGTYTSQSARRKTAATVAGRRVLQDTNNSANDFDVIAAPTPRAFTP